MENSSEPPSGKLPRLSAVDEVDSCSEVADVHEAGLSVDADSGADVDASHVETVDNAVVVPVLRADEEVAPQEEIISEDVHEHENVHGEEEHTEIDLATCGVVAVLQDPEQSLSTNVLTFTRVERTLEDERDYLTQVKSILEDVYDAEQERYSIEGTLSPETSDDDSDEPYDFFYYYDEDEEDEENQAIELDENGQKINDSLLIKDKADLTGEQATTTTTVAEAAAAGGGAPTTEVTESKAVSAASPPKKAYDPQRPHVSVKRGKNGRLYIRFMPLTEAVVRSAWGTVQPRLDAELEAQMLPEDCRAMRAQRTVHSPSSAAAAAAAARPHRPFPGVHEMPHLATGGSAAGEAEEREKERHEREGGGVYSNERVRGQTGFSATLLKTCERIRATRNKHASQTDDMSSPHYSVPVLPPVLNTVSHSARKTERETHECVYSPISLQSPKKMMSNNDNDDPLPRVWKTFLPGVFGDKCHFIGAQWNEKRSNSNSMKSPLSAHSAAASNARKQSFSVSTLSHLSNASGKQAAVGIHAADAFAELRSEVMLTKLPPISIIHTSIKNERTEHHSFSIPRPFLPSSLMESGTHKSTCSLPEYAAAEQSLEEEREQLEVVQDIIEEVRDEYMRSLH